jgi:hypothetical protein
VTPDYKTLCDKSFKKYKTGFAMIQAAIITQREQTRASRAMITPHTAQIFFEAACKADACACADAGSTKPCQEDEIAATHPADRFLVSWRIYHQ